MYAVETDLKPGTQLPNLSLESPGQGTLYLADYRHHHNLVIVFAADPDSELIRGLVLRMAQRYQEFAPENAQILVVLHCDMKAATRIQKENEIPFPVLADADGQAHRAAGAGSSSGNPSTAIFVTDRFGEIFAAYRFQTAFGHRPHQREPDPTVDDLLEWLRFIELQCPE